MKKIMYKKMKILEKTLLISDSILLDNRFVQCCIVVEDCIGRIVDADKGDELYYYSPTVSVTVSYLKTHLRRKLIEMGVVFEYSPRKLIEYCEE